MKPPHWRYRKCQKASHRSKRLNPSSVVALEDSHQARIAKYLESASACVEAFLYCFQSMRCWSWRSALMSAFVCISNDCTQWKRQVPSLFGIGIDASPQSFFHNFKGASHTIEKVFSRPFQQYITCSHIPKIAVATSKRNSSRIELENSQSRHGRFETPK
jgi:hypothetical protein